MVASVVAGLIIVSFIGPWDIRSAFVLGILVAFGTCFGDLSESLIKRDLGVKDFGALLPGHGGVLDRFDGLLFCLPIIYFLALYINKV
jgi:phosphatidate cytidylyltransferase